MKQIKLNKDKICILDDDDYEKFSCYQWSSIGKKFIYAARGKRINGKYTKILLHREIVNATKDQIVDHINGNTLDNRKINLRITNRSGNTKNSSLRSDSKTGYKGVRKSYSAKDGDRWSARIQIDKNTRLFLGYFKTKEEAALKYNEYALKFFGEFAKINIIED